MNLAFLAKMGWRLITEPEKLWAKILHAKCARGKMDFSKLEKKRNASNAWKGMVAAREIIKQGTREKVYNGAETFFWREVWLGDIPLKELALAEINLVDSYKTVREYWCCMEGWWWSDLEGLLPPQICNRLSKVML